MKDNFWLIFVIAALGSILLIMSAAAGYFEGKTQGIYEGIKIVKTLEVK